jgi:hypothetical protein
MNTLHKSIAAVATVITLGGSYYYATNCTVRDKTQTFLGVKEKEGSKPIYNGCFVIFDPSGSTSSTYSVPKIDTTYVKQFVEKIRENGDGDIWVTFIDQEAFNNQILYFKVAGKPVKLEAPVRHPGESRIVFNNREAEYKMEIKASEEDAEKAQQLFLSQLSSYLADCNDMIQKQYASRSKSADWSDISGSMNAATRTFSTVAPDSVHFRSVLLVSDGVQSLPKGVQSKPLDAIPSDVKVVTVNNGGSPLNIMRGRATEVENLQRALHLVIHQRKLED